MSVYEWIIGVGTILFLGFMFTIMGGPTEEIFDIIAGMYTGDVTTTITQINSVLTASLFVFSLFVFAWIVKESLRQGERDKAWP